MKLAGQKFTNSSTCHGEAYASDAPLDMAEIVIDGRYPEQAWARNHQSHEMARVMSGQGKLLLKDGETMEVSSNDVIHVRPDTWFAWEGEMAILMACSPAFSPEQYELSGSITYDREDL